MFAPQAQPKLPNLAHPKPPNSAKLGRRQSPVVSGLSLGTLPNPATAATPSTHGPLTTGPLPKKRSSPHAPHPLRRSSLLFLASSAARRSPPRAPRQANDPNVTIRDAEAVLVRTRRHSGPPHSEDMLAEAQAIAIIPRVIKVGFVVGIRRGQGVVMTRDADGEWSLPQFLTLTGGSIGWQAGVQGTDVVLIFRTRTSVENLMRGEKFTIGADAAAAAGPVGRNASAATDAQCLARFLAIRN